MIGGCTLEDEMDQIRKTHRKAGPACMSDSAIECQAIEQRRTSMSKPTDVRKTTLIDVLHTALLDQQAGSLCIYNDLPGLPFHREPWERS